MVSQDKDILDFLVGLSVKVILSANNPIVVDKAKING